VPLQILLACLRDRTNRTRPKIVRPTASRTVQTAYEPVPTTIGIGPINITVPSETGTSKNMAVAIMKAIPTKIRRKPKKTNLTGIDEENTFGDDSAGLERE
jgi:hypothetical protein